jgi:hypothetical protein
MGPHQHALPVGIDLKFTLGIEHQELFPEVWMACNSMCVMGGAMQTALLYCSYISG